MKIWTTEQGAANLKRLLSCVKNKADFAQKAGIPGGPAMISQHQSGVRPISLEAGIAYAKGLGVSLLEISPRLVEMVSDLPPLVPVNPDHAVLRSDRNRLVLIGTVVEHRRHLRAD